MKSYTDALREVLEFVSNPDETWDLLAPISTIQNWIKSKLEENIDVGQPLSKFKNGDILYSYENEDFFACIFKYDEESKERINDGQFLIQKNGTWHRNKGKYPLYDHEGVFYRLATPEEISLLIKI